MADNVTLPGTGAAVATDDVGGVQYQRVKLDVGGDGASVPVVGTLPVSGPLTDTQLRATAVPVSGTVTATGPLTDTQLRAAAVPVSGPLTDTQLRATAVPVSGTVTATGPLTDTQLRAAAVPVSGPLTDTQLRASLLGTTALTDAQLRASAVLVSGPLTDTQLRATAVPVSGTVTATGPLTDTQLRATAVPVSGPLTDTQLRATAVPVAGPLTDTQLRASALPVVESALVLTGQAAQTATVANILEAVASATPTTVDNYRSASIQVVSTGTGGTFIFEQSNDNTNWVALPVFNAALTSGVAIVAAITATVSAIVYTVPLRCRYLRLRIATAITGGSIQAFSRFSTEPWTPTVASVAAPGTGQLTANVNLVSGTNLIGDIGVQYRGSATGAASPASVLSPATPAAASLKASAGRVIGWFLQNSAASLRSVKLFNQTTVTLGTTAAAFEIDIPAGGVAQFSAEGGLAFSTGIQWAVTGAKGLTDNTGGLGANDVSGFIAWA